MKTYQILFLSLLLFLSYPCSSGSANSSAAITLETDFFRYSIGADGQNLHFIDKRTGQDFLDRKAAPAIARVKIAGKEHLSSSVFADVADQGKFLTVQFAGTDFQMQLRAVENPNFITLTVDDAKEFPIEELTFFDIALLPGSGPDPFAGCALALNLQTNIPEVPQANTRLHALCYPRFGLQGAQTALIGCPQSQLRPIMQTVVAQADDLPHSTIGGPWALDADINRGSYLFNFDGMTEESVEQWIDLAQSLGLNQIDFHGGSSFRFGDCEPNPKIFPDGKKSFKKIIDRLHEAGISAGLHTYAFFIDKKCPWVTPKPDPRLAKDAVFTLASDIPADATAIPVVESTQSMSAITGFFVRNSVTLQIDDELITYKAIQKEPPYAFTDCTRGAYGTTMSPHSAQSKVHHLKECFGLFVPDGDSSLLAEVASKSAEMFNECGFDMIYLDALDGEDILGGGENGWHYGSKFAFELFSRLKKSPLLEMSAFHHHLWYIRSRMGAWDHPTRGHKTFIDIHCAANREIDKMFLPTQLGWWAIKTWSGIQGEPTFSDDIEYLCGKALANGSGISIMGINPENRNKPIYHRLAGIIKNYETLRRSHYFGEEIQKKLRVPGDEFTLQQDEKNQWRLHPATYDRHKAEGSNPGSLTWNVTNLHPAQPLKLRLEALTAALPYQATDSIILADFSQSVSFEDRSSADGVSFDISSSTEQILFEKSTGKLTALNKKLDDPKAAWLQARLSFNPPLDLRHHQALGVWIYGDGNGEILNFQMRSPEHLVSGLGERYILVDFTGWKYFELLEMESDRYAQYRWPYGNAYSIYRENVKFEQVESLSIWCTNIPRHQSIACYIAPVKALPHVSSTMKNPSISIGGKTITFPVIMETGQYLELTSPSECKHYSPEGELLGEVIPIGEIPILEKGTNTIRLNWEDAGNIAPRARVTVIGIGNPL